MKTAQDILRLYAGEILPGRAWNTDTQLQLLTNFLDECGDLRGFVHYLNRHIDEERAACNEPEGDDYPLQGVSPRMNLQVTVEPFEADTQDEIQRIWVVYETPRLVIVRIETKMTYPAPSTMGSHHLDFTLHPQTNKVLEPPVKVKFDGFPWENMGSPLWTTGRGYLDVIFMDYGIEEEYADSGPAGLLWENKE